MFFISDWASFILSLALFKSSSYLAALSLFFSIDAASSWWISELSWIDILSCFPCPDAFYGSGVASAIATGAASCTSSAGTTTVAAFFGSAGLIGLATAFTTFLVGFMAALVTDLALAGATFLITFGFCVSFLGSTAFAFGFY